MFKKYLSENQRRTLIAINENYIKGFHNKSYSQEGEDILLTRIFSRMKSGFYIDIGAHHPKRFSNTFLFYKRGWRGINIDAMPGSMKRFNRLRNRDINIEIPISDKKESLTYYAFNESALNGFSKEISNSRVGKDGYHIIFTKNIQTATLEEILDKHLPNNQEIDFLSIDIEGLDFQALKSNNFEKYRPKIILIEVLGNDFLEIQNNEITQFLKEKNYSIFSKLYYTLIFKENNFIL